MLFILQKWNFVPIKHNSISPLPQPLAVTSLYESDDSRYLVQVEFYSIHLLWLACFTEYNVLRVDPCFCMCQNFLPLSVWTDHILFIHLPGTLEFFHLLVTVENAAMNIRYKHLFEMLLLILFGVYPVVYMVFKKGRKKFQSSSTSPPS